MFNLECHCGNIKLFPEAPPGSLTSCNCSICRRLGALWAYFNLGEVADMSGVRAWGDSFNPAWQAYVIRIPRQYYSG